MRTVLKITLVTLFSIIGVLLGAEVYFRLAVPVHPGVPMGWFWRVPDPITGWSLQPGVSGRSYNDVYEYDVSVQINDLGLRSPADIGYEKKEGVYRIMVLGDSFVEAMQVELEETFGQQLARILNEKGYRVEVINAGVGGWGTDQELLWLRHEGYKYHPDLIILTIYPRNDFMNNYQPLESANNGINLKPYFRLVGGRLELELFPFDPAKAPPVTRH
ncbi:MAG: SGNH/GDSL hydrolase family protein, partial [Anaerolineae bacterium]|nr:SGNH/GDSL hydrolase family protein [Anaerolineae bacterium]